MGPPQNPTRALLYLPFPGASLYLLDGVGVGHIQ
jgi:hypothetical protein